MGVCPPNVMDGTETPYITTPKAVNPIMMTRAQERSLTTLTRVLAGRFDVSVKLHNHCVPSTDGKVVNLPRQMRADKTLNRISQEAVAAHEAGGHLRFTNFVAWFEVIEAIKAGTEDRLMKDLINIFEDARVNELCGQEFPGSAKRMTIDHELTWRQFKTSDKPESDRQAALVSMACEVIAHRPTPWSSPDLDAFMAEARPLFFGCVAQANTAGVIEAVREVLAIYRKHFPETPEGTQEEQNCADDTGNPFMDDDHSDHAVATNAQAQEAQPQNEAEDVDTQRFEKMTLPTTNDEEGEEEGEGGNGDEDTDEEGTGSGDGEGEGEGGETTESDTLGDGEGEGESTESEGETQQNTSDDETTQHATHEGGNHMDGLMTDAEFAALLEEVVESMNETTLEDEREARDLQQQDEDDMGDADQDKSQFDTDYQPQHGNIRYTIRRKPSQVATRKDDSHYTTTAKEFHNGVRVMTNQISRLLEAAGKGGWQTGHRAGMIDHRRIALKTDKKCRRKVEPKKPTAAVSMVIDASGSMSGRREHLASECAVVLAQVVDRLGWEFEVVDFNEPQRGVCEMTIRKGFDAPLNRVTREAIATPFAGGNNPDGYAMEWAYNRLVNRDVDFHFMFVISDGQPCGSHAAGFTPHTHLQQVVADGKKATWFGIGVDGQDVGCYYPNAVTCNAKDLPTVGLGVIKKMLKKVKVKA